MMLTLLPAVAIHCGAIGVMALVRRTPVPTEAPVGELEPEKIDSISPESDPKPDSQIARDLADGQALPTPEHPPAFFRPPVQVPQARAFFARAEMAPGIVPGLDAATLIHVRSAWTGPPNATRTVAITFGLE